jgi:DNA-binding response OmpR family regulator
MATASTSTTPIRILVVEDHEALLEVTVETLSAQGHDVEGISSAEALDELPAHFVADIAVLDLNLPGEDGLSLAQRLRHLQPRLGIIMVTARHTLEHKLAGYENGADIYLTKPTAPEELCATVRALAQRQRLDTTAQRAPFLLDTSTKRLSTPQGDVTLRGSETDLLYAFVLAPQHTLATWQALEKLNKPIDDQGKAQLEVLVSRLRGKLVAHGAPPLPIRAVRGVGYRLCMPLRVN